MTITFVLLIFTQCVILLKKKFNQTHSAMETRKGKEFVMTRKRNCGTDMQGGTEAKPSGPEEVEALKQHLHKVETMNRTLLRELSRHKSLQVQIFSGHFELVMLCLKRVNTQPKAGMLQGQDWTQLYLLIDAMDPTFRPTYEPRTTGLMQNYRMHCLRFLGVPINHIAIVFNGISSESVSKGIYRSKLRGRQ
jgi:predicted Holliday junction resolvase-like endonuclease